jgi:GNAT superfamily N-acetyltransferase
MNSSANDLRISKEKNIPASAVAELFRSLEWSSARCPEKLGAAIAGSHSVRALWDGGVLAGLVTAISDGAMCVYFPYVAIRPEHQGRGWGKKLVESALEDYEDFHHVALISYGDKAGFYEKCGFVADSEKAALFFRRQNGSKHSDGSDGEMAD